MWRSTEFRSYDFVIHVDKEKKYLYYKWGMFNLEIHKEKDGQFIKRLKFAVCNFIKKKYFYYKWGMFSYPCQLLWLT